jgi:hypothetical protein
MGEAQEAWQLAAEQVTQVETEGQRMGLLKLQLPWLDEVRAEAANVRLLPRYDNYLLGYANRALALDAAYARRVHPGGGIINATVLMDGRVVGVWAAKERGKRVEVNVEGFAELEKDVLKGVEEEVNELGRFWEKEVVLIAQDRR